MPADDMPNLKCLVCLEVFSDPVRLACDHCFCLTCLQQLWHGPTTDESQNRSCPECKRNYQVPVCLPTSSMSTPSFRPQILTPHGELRKCGRHNELLKLYCQDDRVCVCALCVVIGEHKNHSVITAEEAYEHLQVSLPSCIDIQYVLLCKSLRFCFWCKSHVENKHFFFATLAYFDHEDIPLKNYCCLLYTSDVYKRQALQNRNAKFDACIICMIPLKNYYFCNVTLDPRTAHPCLEISADLQSVSWSRSAHGPSESAERYDTRYNVLGQQLFSAGTHYWEVAVGSKSYWVVGLATRSAPRKGGLDPEATDLGMNKESWALFHCGDIYTASHDRQSVPVTIQAPLRKLGILLDYFAGRIQFYDADRRAILHTFCVLIYFLSPMGNISGTF
uniref:Uncharacterized protein n=1 Tax=Eptatretus burgeri TaxID=7764 RepID=A0A8C4R1W3_EPTBU